MTKPDAHRLHCIHADPSIATEQEIRSMAETAYEANRTRGQETLRDTFAMSALAGVLHYAASHHRKVPRRWIVARAYQVADEMLAMRDKTPDELATLYPRLDGEPES